MMDLTDPVTLAIQNALTSIAKSSSRVYAQTYDLWADWCSNHGIHPFELLPSNVRLFLIDQYVTRSTRQRQLSALRTLAEIITAMFPTEAVYESQYRLLKRLRIPEDNLSSEERRKRALTTEQVNRILSVWEGNEPISLRNMALLAVAAATGVRRAELVAIEWRDVNLEDGTIIIRHGKGDKTRTVTIYGKYAQRALEKWHSFQGEERQYVFCGLTNSGQLLQDRPMTVDNVYRIIKQTAQRSGIDFSPHDLRRSLATDLLIRTAPLADVKAQLGHRNESTTLRYAQATDAKSRGEKYTTSYGD